MIVTRSVPSSVRPAVSGHGFAVPPVTPELTAEQRAVLRGAPVIADCPWCGGQVFYEPENDRYGDAACLLCAQRATITAYQAFALFADRWRTREWEACS
jgi:hypothetical protein